MKEEYDYLVEEKEVKKDEIQSNNKHLMKHIVELNIQNDQCAQKKYLDSLLNISGETSTTFHQESVEKSKDLVEMIEIQEAKVKHNDIE